MSEAPPTAPISVSESPAAPDERPAPQEPADTAPATTASQAKPLRQPKRDPKWVTEVRDRIRAVLRRSVKPLQEMQARDANEGDTRLLVTDFLTDAFGFDKYEDLTTEYQVKGEFADYGIRIDRQLIAFVEVKRISQRLSERHLRQVQMYAVNEGVEWMILTNARTWQVWHMTGGLPVTLDLVLEIEVMDAGPSKAAVDGLFHLSKEAFSRRTIDEVWQERVATAPKMLAGVVLSEPALNEIRKELRRQTGHNAEPDALARLIRDTVIRPDLI